MSFLRTGTLPRPATHRVGGGPPTHTRPRGWGEGAAARLVTKLGARAEVGRELAYRLYVVSERKKRTAEALSYNGLVQSWPEIVRLAAEGGKPRVSQADVFEDEE